MRHFFTPLFLALILALPLLAEEEPKPNYVFWAELDRVIDGNRVSMNLDLGFDVWLHNQTIALYEKGLSIEKEADREKSQARASKLREWLTDATEIYVQTVKDKLSKPPRYLAVIWADGVNLNEELKKAVP